MVNQNDETGIHYGAIHQNSLSPDAFDQVWQEARDLSHEAAVEEMKEEIAGLMDLSDDCIPDTIQSIFKYIHLKQDDKDEIAEIASTSSDDLPNAERASMIWDIVEQQFNDRYECDDRSWLYESQGYVLRDCLQYSVFVINSPYFTYAPACSPCCPNAGDLDSAWEEMDLNSRAMASARLTDEQWDQLSLAKQHHHYEDVAFKTYCMGLDFFEDNEAPYPVFSVASGKQVVMRDVVIECPSCIYFDGILAKYNSFPVTATPEEFIAEGHGNWGLTETEFKEVYELASQLVRRNKHSCGRCDGTRKVIDRVEQEIE